jgi:prophage tail gpP-like protein
LTDDVTIIIGSQGLGGWQDVRITRGAERVPSAFEITATERYPDQVGSVAIAAGSACQIQIGSDLVLTGYVDRVMPTISAGNHAVRIQGRSKVSDLVDCSVTPDVITGMQVQTSSLLDLAQQIAKPFGVGVKSLTGDNVPVSIPGNGISSHQGQPLVFNVVLSETGYEVIERVARYAQVLVYDDTDGSMILARAGTNSMASGFAQGVNVQSASASFSMDQRYSQYLPMLMSYEFFGQNSGSDSFPTVFDKTVPRYRPLVVISEQFGPNGYYAVQRANWEMARRYGRSQAVRIVCDSWRDSSGALWQPNTLAQIYLPALKLTPTDLWLISEVTFARDGDRGTTAEVTLMPKEAFTQQPVILLPFLGYWPNGSTQGAAATPQ